MFRSKLLPRLCFLPLAAAAGTGNAEAQTTLRFDPPRTHVANRPYQTPNVGNNFDLLTLNLIADGGVSTAVSWGTTVHIANTNVLEFADFAGTSSPFKSSQPFFNQNFSPDVQRGRRHAKLEFFQFQFNRVPEYHRAGYSGASADSSSERAGLPGLSRSHLSGGMDERRYQPCRTGYSAQWQRDSRPVRQ